jgi:hypothetical protein
MASPGEEPRKEKLQRLRRLVVLRAHRYSDEAVERLLHYAPVTDVHTTSIPSVESREQSLYLLRQFIIKGAHRLSEHDLDEILKLAGSFKLNTKSTSDQGEDAEPVGQLKTAENSRASYAGDGLLAEVQQYCEKVCEPFRYPSVVC